MKDIFSRRLKIARKIKGMSLMKLSKAMDGIVSANALAKYERGEIFPSSNVMIKLSSVLDVSVDDFFRPVTVCIDVDSIKYRKRASLGKKKIESINCYASARLEKYLEVEKMSGETSVFSINYFDVPIKSESDVLTIASRFRQDFNLGDSPISNPIEILESAGVKIIEVDASPKFDGDSFTCGDVFVIVLNKNFTAERKRMSLFHETGHKVMNIPDGMNEERLCNVFANEVLLPSDIFIQKIGKIRKDISLVELKDLQRQYGISVEAMMVKARQLGIISENRYTYFYKHKNSSKKFKKEVEDSVFHEEYCKRYERLVFKLLSNEIITESKCASLLETNLSDVHNRLNLI